MEPIYQQLPDLRLIPQGTVILGVPIGTYDFANNAGGKELAGCDQQCQKLIRFPFANCFIFTCYCSNRKLIYFAILMPEMFLL
jgi:hypothetical protein